jgi:hypothetical protein
MRSIARAFWALFIAASVAAGCGKPGLPGAAPSAAHGPAPDQSQAPAPVPEPPQAQQAVNTSPRKEAVAQVAADSLFPAEDWAFEFHVLDVGPFVTTRPREHLLREGNRVVAVYDGEPYATWLIDETGVWRADPRNPGTLLRYLPPMVRDGETWSQQSGGQTVWFQVTRGGGPCLVGAALSLGDEQCWALSVLNRGEQTTFRFAPAMGATVVGAEKSLHPFYKEILSNQRAADLPAEQRTQWLRNAPGPSATEAPVVAAAPAAFAEARDRLLGVTTIRGDLNGDGTEESIRGAFGFWTSTSLDVTDAGGKPMATIGAYRAVQKVEPVRFRGSSRLFFLQYVREPAGPGYATIIDASPNGDQWWTHGTYGWDAKAFGTAATRATVTDDGLVTVEWDMGDPARHTRIRQFRFHHDAERPYAERLAETFRPTGPELVHPTEPLQVLEAAFVARWMGLEGELPRYFASPEAAGAFAQDERITQPDYGPGQVELATVAAQKDMCNLTKQPAKVQPDGTIPFVAGWGGYEWYRAVWGTARAGKNAEGLTVLETVTIIGDCWGGT